MTGSPTKTRKASTLAFIFAMFLGLTAVGAYASTRSEAEERQALLSFGRGRIFLQVESHGEAWYVHPETGERFYLGRPADAFKVMKQLGLGARHDFIAGRTIYPAHVLGRILIDVDDRGKAYYIDPGDKRAYYLGRPADAFKVMRERGLGIANRGLAWIPVAASSAALPAPPTPVAMKSTGCAYNNPACPSERICVNNACQLKVTPVPAPSPAPPANAGCAYNNPSCPTGQTCVNNACVAVAIPLQPIVDAAIAADSAARQRVAQAVAAIGQSYVSGAKSAIEGSPLNMSETISFKGGSRFTLANNLTIDVASVASGSNAEEKIVSFKHSVNGVPTSFIAYPYRLNFGTKKKEENFGYRIEPVSFNQETGEMKAVFTSLTPSLSSTVDLMLACERDRKNWSRCHSYAAFEPKAGEVKFTHGVFTVIGPNDQLEYLRKLAYEFGVCLTADLDYLGINWQTGSIPVRVLNKSGPWEVSEDGITVWSTALTLDDSLLTGTCVYPIFAHEIVHALTRSAPHHGILDEGLADYIKSKVTANDAVMVAENYVSTIGVNEQFNVGADVFSIKYIGQSGDRFGFQVSQAGATTVTRARSGWAAPFSFSGNNKLLVEVMSGDDQKAVINIYVGRRPVYNVETPVCEADNISLASYWRVGGKSVPVDTGVLNQTYLNPYLPLSLVNQPYFGGHSWQEFYMTASCFWSPLESMLGHAQFQSIARMMQDKKNAVSSINFAQDIAGRFGVDLQAVMSRIGLDASIQNVSPWGNYDVVWK
ncbi:hypothetical protein HY633_02825 [Candidatus Uhrbacteria bacterium]|nr:hypothetical protein [Candidatus Uhrbacteria bacterium]